MYKIQLFYGIIEPLDVTQRSETTDVECVVTPSTLLPSFKLISYRKQFQLFKKPPVNSVFYHFSDHFYQGQVIGEIPLSLDGPWTTFKVFSDKFCIDPYIIGLYTYSLTEEKQTKSICRSIINILISFGICCPTHLCIKMSLKDYIRLFS